MSVYHITSSLYSAGNVPLDLNAASQHVILVITAFWGISRCDSGSHDVVQVRGQLCSLGLEKEPSCLVLVSFSCSSCLWPRRYRYSMCITSVFLMRAFSLNSSRIRGMKPGLSWPARRNCRYRARTCFCSLLCRDIGHDRSSHETKLLLLKRRTIRNQVCRKLRGHADSSWVKVKYLQSVQFSADHWSSSDVSLIHAATLKNTLSSACVWAPHRQEDEHRGLWTHHDAPLCLSSADFSVLAGGALIGWEAGRPVGFQVQDRCSRWIWSLSFKPARVKHPMLNN